MLHIENMVKHIMAYDISGICLWELELHNTPWT